MTESERRIKEIDDQIEALRNERKSLKSAISFYDGPCFTELCRIHPNKDALKRSLHNTVRTFLNYQLLHAYRMPTEDVSQTRKLIEDISRVMLKYSSIVQQPDDLVGEDLHPEGWDSLDYPDGIYTDLWCFRKIILSVRAYNTLQRHLFPNKTTVLNLLQLDDDSVKNIRDAGPVIREEIFRAKRYFELKFAGEAAK